MIDAVWSYHTNPLTCGVTKWNVRLARELGVRHEPICGPAHHPLISIKPSELGDNYCARFTRPYDLLLHETRSMGSRERYWIMNAERVWVVSEQDRIDGADVLPCPPTVEYPESRRGYRVLTFGMGHKVAAMRPHYEALQRWLKWQPHYIRLSTGVHEGTPWDTALADAANLLRDVFGPERVDVLGYLSDCALHEEILAADACAVFYDPAFRANNTTGWAVLERDKMLITNLDEHSPQCPALNVHTCVKGHGGRVPTWADVKAILQPSPVCP
jgi:hypothetical protein